MPPRDRPWRTALGDAGAEIVANAVVAKVDPDGTVCIDANADLDLIVDVVGEVGPIVAFRS